MARTKQTARRSTGGKHPVKRLPSNISKTFTITDHTGNKVIIPSRYSQPGLGFFPFQVYILEDAKSLASDKEFPNKLRNYIASNDACVRFNENCRWRLEVFTCPQASILDCIDHHEREKQHRKAVGLGPIMLDRKELIVVDDENWETTGLLSVEYTAQLLGCDGSEREFENHVNDNPSWEDDEEELALPGLRQDLKVQRHTHVDHLAEHFLQTVWDDEGHEWALSSLMERNVALGWPDDPYLLGSNTLPDKPVAERITRGFLRHEKRLRIEGEDEDDEDDEYCYQEWEDLITYGERCDSDTAMPKSIIHFMRQSASPDHASMPNLDLVDIEAHEAVDSVRMKCVDCSHVEYATLDNHFSYSLFIIGQRSEPPQLFFALLNRKLLQHVPWKLHIYYVSSLLSALSHHQDGMAGRPLSGRCPTTYAGPPEQPQSHIFLFLDGYTALDAGPKIATQDSTKTGSVLEVLHAGGWENAAQMLFTYFILCTETPRIMASLDTPTTPSIKASIALTPQHPHNGPCRASEKMHLNLTFSLDAATTQEISINTYDSILTSNNYLWDSFLCVVDPETNEEILPPPSPAYSWNAPRVLSAEQLQALSFPFSAISPARYQILTLEPGESVTRTIVFESSCLFERYQKVLTKGKSYNVRMKPSLTVKRWIWGGVEDNTGPLGCGYIPILETEEVARFTFEGLTEEAMSYPMPDCRVNH